MFAPGPGPGPWALYQNLSKMCNGLLVRQVARTGFSEQDTDKCSAQQKLSANTFRRRILPTGNFDFFYISVSDEIHRAAAVGKGGGPGCRRKSQNFKQAGIDSNPSSSTQAGQRQDQPQKARQANFVLQRPKAPGPQGPRAPGPQSPRAPGLQGSSPPGPGALGPGALSPWSWVLGPWSWVLGPGSLVIGSWVLGPWSWVLGPWSWVLGPWG